MEELNILVVDDDEAIRELYAKALKYKGYKICGLAKNGVEAINLTKKMKFKPNFILMDYHMPRKNGLDAAREILKMDDTIKIILISSDREIEQKIHSTDKINFTKKPISIQNLINIIENMQ